MELGPLDLAYHVDRTSRAHLQLDDLDVFAVTEPHRLICKVAAPRGPLQARGKDKLGEEAVHHASSIR